MQVIAVACKMGMGSGKIHEVHDAKCGTAKTKSAKDAAAAAMCREGLLQLCESWVLHGRTVVVALSLANFIFASSMSSILFALHWALTLRLEMPPVAGLPPVAWQELPPGVGPLCSTSLVRRSRSPYTRPCTTGCAAPGRKRCFTRHD